VQVQLIGADGITQASSSSSSSKQGRLVTVCCRLHQQACRVTRQEHYSVMLLQRYLSINTSSSDHCTHSDTFQAAVLCIACGICQLFGA
jgi:hypothetical protein